MLLRQYAILRVPVLRLKGLEPVPVAMMRALLLVAKADQVYESLEP